MALCLPWLLPASLLWPLPAHTAPAIVRTDKQEKQSPTQLSTRNGEVPLENGPLLDAVGSGGGLAIDPLDPLLDGLVHGLVLGAHDLRHSGGFAAHPLAEGHSWFRQAVRWLRCVCVQHALKSQRSDRAQASAHKTQAPVSEGVGHHELFQRARGGRIARRTSARKTRGFFPAQQPGLGASGQGEPGEEPWGARLSWTIMGHHSTL